MSGSALERAIAALRGGLAVRVGALVVRSVETGRVEAAADVLVSGERAAALGLGNQIAVDGSAPTVIARAEWLDAEAVRAIVDPSRDFDRFLGGPLETKAVGDAESARAALRLARLAGLLPALWIEVGAADAEVMPDDILTGARVTVAVRARLPLEEIGEAQIVAFREDGTGAEHVALVIGAWGEAPPLVRLHSECLTGDVFGSLKCDCGPQLREALRMIAAAGGGVLLYLRQEGRGIGLVNKIRAYALQDRGLDTVDANRRLGFADDERDHGVAAAMLRALKIDAVRLLTNNPAKVAGLEAAGVAVVERVGHHMPVNPHNADYVATKRARSGHLD
ncbi:GTP cyclohydrolase II [Sphingomonas mesophila]|uniref:GTP cyclohydrolase II n=1 Tax=Sphingomonas mesophila TaxID=2303576 RepID=UPI001F074F36|nr:GTP cyclohydrolase II [Sphingomonas mesophila]